MTTEQKPAAKPHEHVWRPVFKSPPIRTELAEYRRCAVCDAEELVHQHRWLTRFRWPKDLQPPPTEYRECAMCGCEEQVSRAGD